MKVMILAAGRGERMRPLTDHTPKPLLKAGGEHLIGWHLRRLSAAGLNEVVVNHAWLGEQIEASLGDGCSYGVSLQYSAEGVALETAAGIARALPLLGNAPFVVVNGDVLCDADFASLQQRATALPAGGAHLLLVPKAGYKTGRDLTLRPDGKVQPCEDGDVPYTFCGVAAYHPAFFANVPVSQPAPLLPWLLAAMAKGLVTGECHTGVWLDVGTPERLQEADLLVRNGALAS
ncbi:N-acetylmuramate alpha-1-phosphate uridylyltransferase MurU [Chitinilyticum piscinae]|uniref:Nucleotidyltransferase family protein n=1 Tax=Chitinilyticum piscinae TaxID=2866724 RepID=A0A8J7FN84_9NEIS|nr:nucleotidyltransferase family protein [Chitinilyticum piscinae]MBE9610575.1 nucleotidyltransferase family protein [Chitinilyticum piscinae]